MESQFKKWGITDDELYKIAIKNLKRLIAPKSVRLQVPPLNKSIIVEYYESTDSSINSSGAFLLDNLNTLEKFPKGIMIAIPTREMVMFTKYDPEVVEFFQIFNESNFNKEARYEKSKDVMVFDSVNWMKAKDCIHKSEIH